MGTTATFPGIGIWQAGALSAEFTSGSWMEPSGSLFLVWLFFPGKTRGDFAHKRGQYLYSYTHHGRQELCTIAQCTRSLFAVILQQMTVSITGQIEDLQIHITWGLTNQYAWEMCARLISALKCGCNTTVQARFWAHLHPTDAKMWA